VTLSRGEKICEGEAQENFTRVRVESPRLLKAAARRDALVRWARDAWRAAAAPETPRH
jgi:hypothetical protein